MTGRLNRNISELAWKVQYATQFITNWIPDAELHATRLIGGVWAVEFWDDGVPNVVHMHGSMRLHRNMTLDDVEMKVEHA